MVRSRSLLCTSSQMDTIKTLNFLYEKGYRLSPKKAQISLTQVKYLGFIITEGERMLEPQKKSLILNTLYPQTKKQLRGFLGMTGFCRIWIPNYGNLARPLHEKLRGKRKSHSTGMRPARWPLVPRRVHHCSPSFRPPKPGEAFQALCF